jgi:hypothetical protein
MNVFDKKFQYLEIPVKGTREFNPAPGCLNKIPDQGRGNIFGRSHGFVAGLPLFNASKLSTSEPDRSVEGVSALTLSARPILKKGTSVGCCPHAGVSFPECFILHAAYRS